MIYLSEDGKSLVKIQSWQEIEERPGYQAKVNQDDIEIKKIIGRYQLPSKQPCGISSCSTPHNRGYLVVCSGGIETNIGHRCGKRIFGVEFKELERIFTKDTNSQRYRENIARKKNQLADIESRIGWLTYGERQGDYCYKELKWHATKGFESQTLQALHKRAEKNDDIIRRHIVMSSEEREYARETGAIDIEEEVVAKIYGLSAIKNYKKLNGLLTTTLGEELNSFKALDEAKLEYDELKRWNNWVNRLEKNVKKVEEIIDDCHRFLTQENTNKIRRYKTLL